MIVKYNNKKWVDILNLFIRSKGAFKKRLIWDQNKKRIIVGKSDFPLLSYRNCGVNLDLLKRDPKRDWMSGMKCFRHLLSLWMMRVGWHLKLLGQISLRCLLGYLLRSLLQLVKSLFPKTREVFTSGRFCLKLVRRKNCHLFVTYLKMKWQVLFCKRDRNWELLLRLKTLMRFRPFCIVRGWLGHQKRVFG